MFNHDSLSIEQRLQCLELILEAAILGPYLEDRPHRQAIAGHLYSVLEAGARHQSFPAEVLAALSQDADALAEIDNIPDALRPSLRPLIPPAGSCK